MYKIYKKALIYGEIQEVQHCIVPNIASQASTSLLNLETVGKAKDYHIFSITIFSMLMIFIVTVRDT